jgi:hypothetical protein
VLSAFRGDVFAKTRVAHRLKFRRNAMRKRYRVLLLAAIVAAVIVPVGFALSLETRPILMPARSDVIAANSSTTVASPALIQTSDPPPAVALQPFYDAAKLFFVGALLVGLAAAVKRAV